MAFGFTKELLLSSGTTVLESLTGLKELDDDYGVGLRRLDDYLIYYMNEGIIKGELDNNKIYLKPGMILWLSPGIRNRFVLAPESNGQANLYHFRFQLKNRDILGLEKGYLLKEEMQNLEGLISMYYHEALGMKTDRNHRMRNILSLLLSDCLHKKSETAGGENRLNSASYDKILNYSRARVKQWPSPNDLAVLAGYSRDYFPRLFRKSFGITPQAWLVQQRIRAIAEEMENSPRSISEIAYEYGYKDIYFFSRQFKKVMGLSPRKWRMMN